MAPGKRGDRSDGLRDAAVAPHQVGVELADAPLLHSPQLRIAEVLELVAELLPEIDDLPSGGDEFGEMLACRIVLHRAGWQCGDEAGNGRCIEPVVLRQPPGRLGELPQLPRIDRADRQTGVQQGGDDAAFVSAAQPLDADRARADRAEPAAQFTPAGAVVADAEPRFSWIQRDIQPLFGNINSHRRGDLYCSP